MAGKKAAPSASNSRSSKPRPPEAGHDTRYIQLQKNYCFACGANNPDGMRLRFTYDEERDCFVCRFRLSKRYTGPPGHCHGGIIATILDEAMGKVNKLRQVVALTSEIKVNYLKPVPLKQSLRVERRSPGKKRRPLHSHRPRAHVRKIRRPLISFEKKLRGCPVLVSALFADTGRGF